mmetsp:Transcript_5368/g.21983  ORF Transcript_5368/g.21983 Transcript_5368/m.21983 type:complete len:223 (-) Transcript_5368:311-979(-)
MSGTLRSSNDPKDRTFFIRRESLADSGANVSVGSFLPERQHRRTAPANLGSSSSSIWWMLSTVGTFLMVSDMVSDREYADSSLQGRRFFPPPSFRGAGQNKLTAAKGTDATTPGRKGPDEGDPAKGGALAPVAAPPPRSSAPVRRAPGAASRSDGAGPRASPTLATAVRARSLGSPDNGGSRSIGKSKAERFQRRPLRGRLPRGERRRKGGRRRRWKKSRVR